MEIMFDYKEWLNEIREFTDTETGTDDANYGNFVEWDVFRNQYENELLLRAGFELPWGQELTFDEYNQLIFKFITEYKLNLGDFLIEDITFNSETDMVRFIEKDTEVGGLIVSKLLDLYGVPSGTEYEKGGSLPKELTYWDNDDELSS